MHSGFELYRRVLVLYSCSSLKYYSLYSISIALYVTPTHTHTRMHTHTHTHAHTHAHTHTHTHTQELRKISRVVTASLLQTSTSLSLHLKSSFSDFQSAPNSRGVNSFPRHWTTPRPRPPYSPQTHAYTPINKKSSFALVFLLLENLAFTRRTFLRKVMAWSTGILLVPGKSV